MYCAEMKRPYAGLCYRRNGEDTAYYEIQMKDGRWIRMSGSGSPDGRYDMLSFSDAIDIYAQINSYEELLRKAEDESQSKTTFLNRMSHEIRTPMNSESARLL